MRKIFIFIVFISMYFLGQAQYAPTSSKTRFVNGIGLSTKDTASLSNVGDTLAMIVGKDSLVYFKYKGYWKPLAYNSSLGSYVKYTDTATMLSPYIRTANYGLTKTSQGLGVDTSLIATRLRVQKGIDSLGSVVSGGYVPYTGATGAVNLGAYGLTSSILNVNGSVTASGAIARGGNFTNTLTASANSDVLVGLDVNPTFVNGIFTGVKNIPARINNHYFWNGLGNQSTTLAIGSESLNSNTYEGNTAIGYQAGFNNALYQNSTIIGYQASYSNPTVSTAVSNTIIGYQAGYSGSYQENVYIGHQAGYTLNGAGRRGVAIGYQAAYGSGTEHQAGEFVFIGRRAGYSIATAGGFSNTSFGVGIGSSALFALTTGIGNTAIGENVLSQITTGRDNVALGRWAGRYINGGGANTISSGNIYIGTSTRASVDSSYNEIVIAGYNGSSTGIGLGSNTTILGSSATVTTAVRGRLLLGSTTDNGSNQLQVTGSALATSFVKSGGTSSQILAADGSVITAGTNITISGGTISSSGGGGGTVTGYILYNSVQYDVNTTLESNVEIVENR